MFEAEARWLRRALDAFDPERLSPLLNLGSSSAAVRETVQPWIEAELFRPLRARGDRRPCMSTCARRPGSRSAPI